MATKQTNQLSKPNSRNSKGQFEKKKQLKTASGAYGQVQVVTSLRLKRRYVNNGYKLSCYLPDDVFTALTVLGIQLGVTADEVLRGLVDMHLASADQIGGLKHFIPALQ